MDEDLPLGFPPRDPDDATRARALERVTRAIRRRRSRRRAIVVIPVLAVLSAGAMLVAGSRTGDSEHDRVTGVADVPGGFERDPDVPWRHAVLSTDDRTLTITADTPLAGQAGCEPPKVATEVVERDDVVIVGLVEVDRPPPTTAPEACIQVIRTTTVEVVLDRPLGEREVRDPLRPDAPTLYREADVVRVTYVPPGFERESGPWWGSFAGPEQTFAADGADWYFVVEQRDVEVTEPNEGTSTPVLVNGIEGIRTTGLMNNTVESIRFPLGDLTVTVRGEMQGPPTFTHADELMRIAEGVRAPS